MTILPAAYLPSVEYMAELLRGDCTIDLGEHFIKRSERNRGRILATDGVMELTAQVQHADRPRQPMHTLRLDYSKRWQHQHWGAIVSSYKGSPYFDYYAAEFEPFYQREYSFLAEYNLQMLAVMCRLAAIQMPRVSEQYLLAGADDLDLRPKHKKGPTFKTEPYIQVFSESQPFAENLSFIDLLFAEGPASIEVLRRCRRG